MAAISAAMVKELRLKTDAPMMECKKALTEADGDMAKAEEILRVKLGNKATKAASRITAEGVVAVYISEDRKVGAILEVNSETDFVAKNPEFIQMAKDAVRLVADNQKNAFRDQTCKKHPQSNGNQHNTAQPFDGRAVTSSSHSNPPSYH